MVTRTPLFLAFAALLIAPLTFAADDKTRPTAPSEQQAQKQNQQKDAGDATPLTADKVLCKLHEDNMKEVAMGKMAQDKGASPEVKTFGQMLITDHHAADEQVKELAKAQNVDLQKKDDKGAEHKDAHPKAGEGAKAQDQPMDAEGHGKLHGLTGAEFDKEFAQMMAKDHQKTLAMLDKVKQDNNLAALHPLADKLRPTIEKHQQTAQQISMKLGAQASAK